MVVSKPVTVDDWAIASGSTAIISVTNKAAPPLARSIRKLRHSSVILLALAKKYELPILAIGLGEKEDDLQIFNADKFANAFVSTN